jgi:hypothetical protein
MNAIKSGPSILFIPPIVECFSQATFFQRRRNPIVQREVTLKAFFLRPAGKVSHFHAGCIRHCHCTSIASGPKVVVRASASTATTVTWWVPAASEAAE